MLNALTFDLEYWWCSEFMKHIKPELEQDMVEETTRPVLDTLDKSGTKATFFVLGQLAEKHPETVREIHRSGHEIASHGYCHKMIGELGRKGFAEDVRKSARILRSITGVKPIGYRAPNFSVSGETAWALQVLEDLGFGYDSSVFPVSRRLVGLYGVSDAPLEPYRPSRHNISMRADKGIMEFPLTVYRLLGMNIPVAGGFYFRFWPLWALSKAIRKANSEGRPAVLYLHPWEIYPHIPRREKSFSAVIKRRYGAGPALDKLAGLLAKHDFCPIGDLGFPV